MYLFRILFDVIVLIGLTTAEIQTSEAYAESYSYAQSESKSLDPVNQFFIQVRDESQLHLYGCTEDVSCGTLLRYRTYNGTCNNIEHPRWSSVGDCQLRLLPAQYKDSSDLRESVRGWPLPLPRDISYRLVRNLDRPAKHLSHFFTIFGQAVAHDISLSTPPLLEGLTGNGIICCPPEKANDDRCLPLIVSENDPFYSQFNVTCFDVIRQDPCKRCDPVTRNIPNKVTGSLDCHLVYGLTETDADKLRKNDGSGKLDFVQEQGPMMQKNQNKKIPFCFSKDYTQCFQSGDVRVNQHSFLMSVHTILLREHNRVAEKLIQINPHWQEETLYQEARRIVGGEWQALIYGSYLPHLLGSEHISAFGLSTGDDTSYDPSVRLGSILESTTSGFRAHSMVHSDVGYDGLKFKSIFFNNQLLHEGHLDDLVRGAESEHSWMFSKFMTPSISQNLLKIDGHQYGTDMAAIDILRGRDHGLPTYVQAVEYCSGGDIVIIDFDQLTQTMPERNVNQLRRNYEDVRDIDLYMGMLMEYHSVRGSVLTPTAACFAARQFYTLKYGDRFYFEHVNEVNSFTTDQITALRGVEISKLLCDNTDINEVSKNAFLKPGSDNPVVSCSSLPDLDLSLWREDSGAF